MQTQTLTMAKTAGQWFRAMDQPATEFGLTPLTVIVGQRPKGLRGTLYRNGPGRLTLGAERVGHWFDGDGAILAVHLGDPTTATYRYVQTEGYQADQQSGRFQGRGYGMHASGSYWQRWRSPLKNAANTSVLALPDRLLALWEGGAPHALDLETLETLGLDDLGAGLQDSPYSAHPKRDPLTGEIYNFGVKVGRQPQLCLTRCYRNGKLLQQQVLPLPGIPLIHDFVLAGQYLIFCISPIRLQVLPLLLQLQTYSEALTWQPQLGTQILIVDRDTLQPVSQIEAEPWFQWHFGNGAVNADGEVLLNFVRYEDFTTNQFLQEVATGNTQTPALGRLWELRINPQAGKILQSTPVSDRGCEFPVVHPAQVGQPFRYTYCAHHRDGVDISRELFGAIARYDAQAQAWTVADCGEGCYPMEPILAPDADDPQQTWLLTVVFDSTRQTSQVWIYDADQLEAGPICRMALPQPIPLGFHGTWHPASDA